MIIGLGTAAIGRPSYINIRQDSFEYNDLEQFRAKGIQVLDEAYAHGIRYYDTAPGYGMAEQLLLEWAKNKTDIEIATKWGYTYVANFDVNASQHEVKEHSLDKLQEQWNFSEKLLPQLTTYQIHSATLDTGVLENNAVLERLFELKTTHQIKIGITTSGTNQQQIIELAKAIERNKTPLFDVYQVTYNLFEQSLETILKQLSKDGKRVIIKEAMANGRVFPNEQFRDYSERYSLLKTLADKYNVGLDAIAIRFVEQSIRPFCILSGASEPSHVSQNLKAKEFELSSADMEQLKKIKVDTEVYWQERKNLVWQ